MTPKTSKRRTERLSHALLHSRFFDLVDWYTRNLPKRHTVRIYPSLANVLESCPAEAQALGITALPGGGYQYREFRLTTTRVDD